MLERNFNESGRSMVEMLGVLAIIGVLTVGGLSGYTTAMNKHKANEILNAAAVRAMDVSAQIQRGVDPSTATRSVITELVGSAEIGSASPVGTEQFKLNFTSPIDDAICNQMKNIAGENSAVGVACDRLLYNNDMSAPVQMGACWDSNGDGPTTGDQDCSEEPTGCQICVKGELIDSNAKCGANKVCHDGTCSPSELEGTGCAKNSDCKTLDPTNCGNGECYCNYGGNGDCASGPSGKVGTCTKVSASLKDDDLAGFVWGVRMDWYSAKNFCAAQNMRMASISDFNCPYTLAEYRATSPTYPWGYCCETKEEADIQGDGCTDFSANIQAIADEVQDVFWLKELMKTSNSCYAFSVYTTDSGVNANFYRGDLSVYALCK